MNSIDRVIHFENLDNLKNTMDHEKKTIFFLVFDSKLKKIRKKFLNQFWIVFFIKPSFIKVNEAFKSINPQGSWAEKDITTDNLETTFLANLDHFPFYTNQIHDLMNKRIPLNHFELKLLECLDLGIPGKNLTEHLPASSSKIERAKRKLKMRFEVEGLTDCALIRRAKEKGYLNA